MSDYAETIKRALLPVDFWRAELSEFSEKSNKDWHDGGLCPFHDDNKKGTFKVNENGGYHCFSCGAGNGDIIAFHMQLNGFDFITSCESIARDFGIELKDNKSAPIKKRVISIGDTHHKSKIEFLISALSFILLVNSKDKKDLDNQTLWGHGVVLCCDYVAARDKALKTLTRIYGDPRGKQFSYEHFMGCIKRLLTLYKSMVCGIENYELFFMPLEIFNEDEIKYGRYLAYCLSNMENKQCQ